MIQLIQRSGRTIFFSSHILGDVERVADRIGVLVDGVLRVDCPTDHFKETLRQVVLEFDGSVPDSSPPARAWSASGRVGSKLELIIVGYGDEHAADWPSRWARLDRSDRNEPGRRLHRLHPRTGPPNCQLQMGACPMLKSLIWKEFRELLPMCATAVATQALLFSYALSAWRLHRPGDAYAIWPLSYVTALLLGVAIGIWQNMRDDNQNTFQFLLHRPVNRLLIFGIRILYGVAVCLVVGMAPLIGFSAWLKSVRAEPGSFPLES